MGSTDRQLKNERNGTAVIAMNHDLRSRFCMMALHAGFHSNCESCWQTPPCRLIQSISGGVIATRRKVWKHASDRGMLKPSNKKKTTVRIAHIRRRKCSALKSSSTPMQTIGRTSPRISSISPAATTPAPASTGEP